jgi:hypothetical protein
MKHTQYMKFGYTDHSPNDHSPNYQSPNDQSPNDQSPKATILRTTILRKRPFSERPILGRLINAKPFQNFYTFSRIFLSAAPDFSSLPQATGT